MHSFSLLKWRRWTTCSLSLHIASEVKRKNSNLLISELHLWNEKGTPLWHFWRMNGGCSDDDTRANKERWTARKRERERDNVLFTRRPPIIESVCWSVGLSVGRLVRVDRRRTLCLIIEAAFRLLVFWRVLCKCDQIQYFFKQFNNNNIKSNFQWRYLYMFF